MTKHQTKKTAKRKPAWDVQTREAAAGLGVSETKLSQQVETELIRLVAEDIAKKEIARLRAQHMDANVSAKGMESQFERKVKKEGAVFPGDR